MTNGDKGGRGVKKSHFCGDVIFEWPHRGLCSMPLLNEFLCTLEYLINGCLNSRESKMKITPAVCLITFDDVN